MFAGTIGLLEEPVSEPLESFRSGSTALDVRETQTYLDDDSQVQHGLAASTIETTTSQISLGSRGQIDVEQVGTRTDVHTEWVADVTTTGFVAAASTAGQDPTFPFDVIRSQTHQHVQPVRLDPTAFVRSRDDISLWFSGSKAETPSELDPDDVEMGYGQDANQTGGNLGIGYRTSWQGTTAKGVLYASGYLAVYNDSWGPVKFARFVRDAVLPIAEVPEAEESGSEQTTLGDDGECVECGREPDRGLTGDGHCIVCRDKAEEQGGEA